MISVRRPWHTTVLPVTQELPDMSRHVDLRWETGPGPPAHVHVVWQEGADRQETLLASGVRSITASFQMQGCRPAYHPGMAR